MVFLLARWVVILFLREDSSYFQLQAYKHSTFITKLSPLENAFASVVAFAITLVNAGLTW